jgi:hypothetical protein
MVMRGKPLGVTSMEAGTSTGGRDVDRRPGIELAAS